MIPQRAFVLLAAALLCGCILYAPVDLGDLGGPGDLEETVVEGESGPKIVLVAVSGVISDEETRGALAFGTQPSVVVEVRNALELAEEDPEVAGILLRINTPGGSVSASDTLHHEIELWRTRTGRPVVAYLNGLATSGGYYVAMAADRVVAHPTAITGSIGVVRPGLSLEGLMEKYGVSDQTVVSGPYKDTGSLFRDMRSDERKQLQTVIDDLYARFTDVVAKGRPGLDREKIAKLADGRVFTANQALAAGLVDELGYLDDAIQGIEQRAGATESRVVVYNRSNQVRENIYSRGPNVSVNITDVNLLPIPRERLAPGFYYLWPAAILP